jgi:hypothetical protein
MIPSMIALLVTLLLAPEVTTDVGEVATLSVRWDKGAVTILRVERVLLARPTHLIRFRGRFEARAVVGDKMLDFVRFDFPLLAPAESADEMTDEANQIGAKLRAHVTATTTVRVPIPHGATAIGVYDTGTHKLVTAPLGAATPAAASPSRPSGHLPAGTPPAPPPPGSAAGAGGSTRR